jgi:hypothetical protein
MDQGLVVGYGFSKQMQESGLHLVNKLRSMSWPLEGAFWFLFPEPEDWKLVIVSPTVMDRGPRDAYDKIKKAISKLPSKVEKPSLRDIIVTSPDNVIYRNLKLVSNELSLGGIEIQRLRETSIAGFYVEDAIVYRFNPMTS